MDFMGLGALDSLRIQQKAHVLDDIQVLGFDNNKQAIWLAYKLSTINQNVEKQAQAVTNMLKGRILDSTRPNHVSKQVLETIERGITRNAK